MVFLGCFIGAWFFRTALHIFLKSAAIDDSEVMKTA